MSGSPENAAPDLKLQFLGLAFAGADLVFEITADGVVRFALGAAEQLTGKPLDAFLGSPWDEIVAPHDRDLLATLLANIKPGERQGPLRVELSARDGGRLSRFASLSVFMLPQRQGRLSCALSLGAAASPGGAARRDDGFMDMTAFEAASQTVLTEAERTGVAVKVNLIEMAGLDAAVAGMAPPDAEQAKRRIAATLRAESYAGLGASEVSSERFALLRAAGAPNERLYERLRTASGADVKAEVSDLNMEGQTPAQGLRALRYALNRFIEDGPTEAASTFKASMDRTVRDAARFKAMMAASDFHLAYQPVVSLGGETLHHFEALARFEANASPADTIKLAEELDLICEFDLAVAKSVARLLETSKTKIAVNISAASLMRPGFPEALIAINAASTGVRPRMLLELTETQTLTDLPLANTILRALRTAGHLVCLDDFGAGAASLDYLRHLDLDFVKIDGRYIQSSGEQPRDATIVKHVAALCRDLQIATIAEMIETAEAARLAADMGVSLGQGWHYGKPTAQPIWSPAPKAGPAAARRKGAVDQWG